MKYSLKGKTIWDICLSYRFTYPLVLYVLFISYSHRSFKRAHEPPDVPRRCFTRSSVSLVWPMSTALREWKIRTPRLLELEWTYSCIAFLYRGSSFKHLLTSTHYLSSLFDAERTTGMPNILADLTKSWPTLWVGNDHWPGFLFELFRHTIFIYLNSVSVYSSLIHHNKTSLSTWASDNQSSALS